ncbi:uncharacterized protein TNCV_4550211 [Trichonephila clavipes]|nr:uncharacterized protein TNCV_4550211 [Trichonephila clavipes]
MAALVSEYTLEFFTLLNARGKKKLIEWCMKEGLIASSYECPKCNEQMGLNERKSVVLDGFEWRCRKKGVNAHDGTPLLLKYSRTMHHRVEPIDPAATESEVGTEESSEQDTDSTSVGRPDEVFLDPLFVRSLPQHEVFLERMRAVKSCFAVFLGACVWMRNILYSDDCIDNIQSLPKLKHGEENANFRKPIRIEEDAIRCKGRWKYSNTLDIRVSMTSRKKIEDSERWRSVGHIEAGQSITDAALFFGVHHSVNSRLWKQFQTTQAVVRMPVGGHPRISTPVEDRYIAIVAKRNRRATSTRDIYGYSVHWIWSEQGARNQPQNITEHHAFRGGSIMVWAGISLGYCTDLHIFKRGYVTAIRYRD